MIQNVSLKCCYPNVIIDFFFLYLSLSFGDNTQYLMYCYRFVNQLVMIVVEVKN